MQIGSLTVSKGELQIRTLTDQPCEKKEPISPMHFNSNSFLTDRVRCGKKTPPNKFNVLDHGFWTGIYLHFLSLITQGVVQMKWHLYPFILQLSAERLSSVYYISIQDLSCILKAWISTSVVWYKNILRHTLVPCKPILAPTFTYHLLAIVFIIFLKKSLKN